MAAPSTHTTAAEAILASVDAGPSGLAVSLGDTDVMLAQAHSLLGKAAGTGTHYASAEAAIADYASVQSTTNDLTGRVKAARSALLHAQLADLV